MKRSVNLLVCLGIFVMGIVLAQANDSKETVATAKKPCCEEEKKGETTPAGKTAAPKERFGPPYACLQYLLYEDDMIALWAADEYPDLPCTGAPDEIYLWTAAGIAAPQTCEFGCENLSLRPLAVANPFLSAPLAMNAKYTNKPLINEVRLPNGRPDETWNYKDGIKKLGEMQFDYVAVLQDNGTRVAVRLSAGIADFDKVRFAAAPPPPKIRRRTIPITIGFETDLPDAVLATLPVVTARPWPRHPTSKTAFTVDWEGGAGNNAQATYYVTTVKPVTVTPRTTVKKSDK